MRNNRYPIARINPAPRFSLVWVIPLTAALIGSWLVFKYYNERGTMVTITFDKASGIEAKKTPIRYKDIAVGRVKKLSLTPDLKKVKVIAEIFPDMAANLGSKTRFWVERPRVTFQGISGLDTLLAGVHIGIDPGEKSPALEQYTGLARAPVVTTDEKGRSIVLNSDSLGSLNIGSPVYYHKINVGEVTDYQLNDHNGSVDISLYVHAPYDKKIKTNTRFWNAGGMGLDLNASGVSVRVESLVSLLIGGIAFETPKNRLGYPLDGETSFKLYSSYKQAKDDTQRLNKLFYVMYFDDSLHGLKPEAVIEYGGVKVGKVESIVLKQSRKNTQLNTLVKVSLYVDKFSDKNQRAEAENTLQNLVSNGLKAQLTVDSLITGAQLIALNMPKKPLSQHAIKAVFALLPTDPQEPAMFPTTNALTSLLNFDATEITNELNKAIRSVTALVNSNDVKKTIKGLASTSENIGKITLELQQKGFSGELVKTLNSAQTTANSINHLLNDTRRTLRVLQKDGSLALRTITNVSNKLQKDARVTLRTLTNVSNKLQKEASVTLRTLTNVSNTLQKDTSHSLRTLNNVSNKLQQDSRIAIRTLTKDGSIALRTFSNVSNKLQKDTSHTLRTVNNVGNKLQHDIRTTLHHLNHTTVTLNKGLKTTLSEDSALQYKIQQLMNDLGEASNSFSVLADTLQRKPNAVIFGK
ncbi:MAG: MCE family protein [Cocleimonas sp.]|nr:MCE family protein [Cocleimonas sp.]